MGDGVKQRDYIAQPLGDNPTRAEIEEFVKTLRAEHAKTEDKVEFYNKYTGYFNCYAYASGGVGSPFALDGYDAFFRTCAIPGASVGKPMRFITPEELDRAVVADGYQRVVPANASPAQRQQLNQQAAEMIKPGYTLVAAFIDNTGNSQSFHFAVRDNGKNWSQKFGWGKIEYDDYDRSRIDPPHSGKNFFQQTTGSDTAWDNAQRFVGYYWRPDAGLNVTGGIVPVVPVRSQETGVISHDVWRGIGGDIRAAKEVTGWSLVQSKDSFKLGLQHADGDATFVNLPKSVLLQLDGVYHIEFSDPSGPDTELQIFPNGKVKQLSHEDKDIKRPSPFR